MFFVLEVKWTIMIIVIRTHNNNCMAKRSISPIPTMYVHTNIDNTLTSWIVRSHLSISLNVACDVMSYISITPCIVLITSSHMLTQYSYLCSPKELFCESIKSLLSRCVPTCKSFHGIIINSKFPLLAQEN